MTRLVLLLAVSVHVVVVSAQPNAPCYSYTDCGSCTEAVISINNAFYTHPCGWSHSTNTCENCVNMLSASECAETDYCVTGSQADFYSDTNDQTNDDYFCGGAHLNTDRTTYCSQSSSPPSPPSPSSDDDTKTLAIGLGVGIPVGLLLIGGGIYYYRKRKSTPPELAINLM